MAEHAQLKVVFVVAEARTVKQQQQLLGEHRVHGDIVQSSVQDGHRLLAYKILMGYVWTYSACGHVPHVAKTDDNVDMDVAELLEILGSRRDGDKQFIACSVPSRNIATGLFRLYFLFDQPKLINPILTSDVVKSFNMNRNSFTIFFRTPGPPSHARQLEPDEGECDPVLGEGDHCL